MEANDKMTVSLKNTAAIVMIDEGIFEHFHSLLLGRAKLDILKHLAILQQDGKCKSMALWDLKTACLVFCRGCSTWIESWDHVWAHGAIQ